MLKFLALLSLILFLNKKCECNNITYECSIFSQNYGQYLYGSSKAVTGFFQLRRAFVWAPLFSSTNVEFLNDDDAGVWQLKNLPILGKNYFYLNNKKYNESLFAAITKQKKSLKNRYVYLYNMNKGRVDYHDKNDIDQYGIRLKFVWQIRPLNNKVNHVELWNAFYEEPLYTASRWNSFTLDRRNIFTYNEDFQTKEKNWILICKDNIIPKLEKI